jgi:hypothetical protein
VTVSVTATLTVTTKGIVASSQSCQDAGSQQSSSQHAHAGRSSQTTARTSKAVAAKVMTIHELPNLLAALDEGELSQQQQQAIRQGVMHTVGRGGLVVGDRRVTSRDEGGHSGHTLEGDLHLDDCTPRAHGSYRWFADPMDPMDQPYDHNYETACEVDEAMLQGLNDTLLVRAARRGRTSSVIFLLELGADRTAHSDFGETPLFAACLEGHVDVVRLLLDFIPPGPNWTPCPGSPFARSIALWRRPLRALKATFTETHLFTGYSILAAAW